MDPSDFKDPIDLELLLPAAVRTGLKCAGFAEFGAWIAESLSMLEHLPSESPPIVP